MSLPRARRSETPRHSAESAPWSFRQPGPKSGSVPHRADTSRPPAEISAAENSTVTTTGGGRYATQPNMTAWQSSVGHSHSFASRYKQTWHCEVFHGKKFWH